MTYRYIVLCVAFLLPSVLHAQVSISEIMYDLSGTDTDHEWVEIHNEDGGSISISGWQFSDGANHNLNEPPANGGTGSTTIPGNGFAILAANATTFLADHPGYSGIVIDTVMSLTNTGATLKILKEGTALDTVSYTASTGAAGDGNSLQEVGGSWTSGPPTPGAENKEGEPSDDTTTPPADDEESPTAVAGTPHIDLTVSPLIIAGIAMKVEAKVFDIDPTMGTIELAVGKFEWNFGDGSSLTTDGFMPVTHIYRTPGDYVLHFSYSKKELVTVPFLTKRLTIKVSSPGVVISSVRGDGSVEIWNNATLEQDMTGWALRNSLGQEFLFPNGTILLPGKKIILFSDVLGFSARTNETLTLLYPSRLAAFVKTPTLPPLPTPVKKVVAVKTTAVKSTTPTPTVLAAEAVAPVVEPSPLPAENTPPIPEEQHRSPFVRYGIFAGFGILVIGAVVLMLKVRRKSPPAEGELIRAEDITIVE